MLLQLVSSERDRSCAPDRGPTPAYKTRPFCPHSVADEAAIQVVSANRTVQYSMDLGSFRLVFVRGWRRLVFQAPVDAQNSRLGFCAEYGSIVEWHRSAQRDRAPADLRSTDIMKSQVAKELH
jgi:hypothetical protein